MIRSGLAAVLSFMFPGLGHALVKLQIIKGLIVAFTYMTVVVIMFSTGRVFLMLFMIPVLHILSAASAYRS